MFENSNEYIWYARSSINFLVLQQLHRHNTPVINTNILTVVKQIANLSYQPFNINLACPIDILRPVKRLRIAQALITHIETGLWVPRFKN